MVVSLEPELPEGVYTIAWRNISDVDGHPLSGSFVFFVGEASFEAPGEVQQPPLFASPLKPVLPWVVLIGGILLAGTPLACLLVLAPVMERNEHRRIRGRIEGITLLAGVTMLAGSAAQLLLQASVTGLGISTIVFDTSWGEAWWIRTLLAALATVSYVAIRQVASPRWLPRLRAGAVILGRCAVAAVSLSSHAAATQYVEFAATLVDLTHTVAAAVWGGGLVAFLLVIAMTARPSDRDSGRVLRAVMPRFSILGLLVTFTLFVTGAYSSWLQMVTVEAFSTPYGMGVIVKVVVLIVLVGLGAVNLLWVRRRLSETTTASRGTSWLRHIMRTEVVGILLAVVAAGGIASMEPGKQTVARAQGAEISDTGTDGDLGIALAVRPGSLGMNEVTATLTRRGDAYGNATSVVAMLTFVDAELGEVELPLEHRGDGVWSVGGVPLSIAGQ